MLTIKTDLGDAVVFLGDCLKIIPTLDIKIDAIVTDPPYGIGKKWVGGFKSGGWGRGHLEKQERNAWDASPPMKETWPLLL